MVVPEVLLVPPVYSPLGPFIPESTDGSSSSGTVPVKEEKEKDSVAEEPASASSSATATATGDVSNGTADKRSTRVRLPTFTAAQLMKERSVRHVDQAVALESAVLKVAAAREFAYVQRQKLEERLEGIIAVLPTMSFYKMLYESDTELGRMAPADISRGNPLGRDRHGNEYWLLFAQRRMSLVAQGLAVTFLNGPQGATYNPQVFLRERSGMWSVHCGQNLPELIAEFSSSILCEHYLRENMIEGLHYTKKSLLSRHLVFKPMQLEWVERQARAESYLRDTANILAGLDVISSVKKLETLWAKFIEVRCFVHNGYTFRNEPDTTLSKQGNDRHEKDALQRRLKKMRDTYQEEIVEHHPVKGWYRFDPMGRLRELWCATSADRMHADPMVCQQMILTAKRSKFLSTLIPHLPPPVPAGTVNPASTNASTTASDPSIVMQPSALQGHTVAQNAIKAEVSHPATTALSTDTISLPRSASAATVATALAPLVLPVPVAPIAPSNASIMSSSGNTPSISSSAQAQSVDPLSSSMTVIQSSTKPADVAVQVESKSTATSTGVSVAETVKEEVLEVKAASAITEGNGQGQGHSEELGHAYEMVSVPHKMKAPTSDAPSAVAAANKDDTTGVLSGSKDHALDTHALDTFHDTQPMDTGDSDVPPGKSVAEVKDGLNDSVIVARTLAIESIAPECDGDRMDVDVSQEGQTGVSPPVVPVDPVRVEGLSAVAVGESESPLVAGEDEGDGDGEGIVEDDMEGEGEGDEEGAWTPQSTSQGSPRQGPIEVHGAQPSSGSHSGTNSARVKVRHSCSNKVKIVITRTSAHHIIMHHHALSCHMRYSALHHSAISVST